MTRVVWDKAGERRYEMGVDRGVLYVNGTAVPWNGLVSVDEAASGGESQSYYMDGVKYLNRSMREEYEATISAFYSPPEFDVCDGSAPLAQGVTVTQQRRVPFSLTYRTMIGNDISGLEAGYKIHLIYNAAASPTQRSYGTTSEDLDPMVLNWGITTKPLSIPGMRPSAHIIIDSTTVDPVALEVMENILYGDVDHAPRLLDPSEILSIFVHPFDFTVTENPDGTYTISGPLSSVQMLDADHYKIDHDTVVNLTADTAEISSDE